MVSPPMATSRQCSNRSALRDANLSGRFEAAFERVPVRRFPRPPGYPEAQNPIACFGADCLGQKTEFSLRAKLRRAWRLSRGMLIFIKYLFPCGFY